MAACRAKNRLSENLFFLFADGRLQCDTLSSEFLYRIFSPPYLTDELWLLRLCTVSECRNASL